MKYRLLGKTGLRVSEIGFGCWGIGGGMWGSTDDDGAIKALQTAYDNGINFFDTALVYGDGHSERLVAKAVGEEKGVVIASKIPPGNLGWPASGHTKADDAFSRDYVIRTAKISFANLGNRPIDLMQLHVWHDNWLNEKGWYEGLVELRDKGMIRHFGVSVNSLQPETAVKLAESGKAESFQVIYNIFEQRPEDKLFPAATKSNAGIIARVPFDEGSLTGKFTYDTKFDDWRKNYFTPKRLKETVDRVEKLRWLEKKDRTLAQAALQFCLANPAVSSVIPGMRKVNHVLDNVKAAEGALTKEEIKKLKAHRWDFSTGL